MDTTLMRASGTGAFQGHAAATALTSSSVDGMPLTAGQRQALTRLCAFVLDPDSSVLVIEGYSGTGKTTLLKAFLAEIPRLVGLLKLLHANHPLIDELTFHLTATTNKAAERLTEASGIDACTIHSLLGLRVDTDYRTGKSTLVRPRSSPLLENAFLAIDEASKASGELIRHVFDCTRNAKILWIGDPAQLIDFRMRGAPIFSSGFDTVRLTEIVRQEAGSPIAALGERFRETVESGRFFTFTPDGEHVRHLDREAFDTAMLADFQRPGCTGSSVKFLAWRNQRVVACNRAIHEALSGSKEFVAGDYAVCNRHMATSSCRLRTDQTVRITAIEPDVHYGVAGATYTLDDRHRAFMPRDSADRKRVLATLKARDDVPALRAIHENWIDLRAAYGCTVDKSQGSTYGRVYIDLDDISRCPNANYLARMLYVAVTRARHQVTFTGDFV